MREFNAILRLCGVQGLLSLFKSVPETRFALIRLGHSGFGGSQAVFWTVLGDMSSGAQRGKTCCQDGTDVPVELAFRLSSFKKRLGVVDFFCSEEEPLPWVEPELLLFCLELEEPLLDLLSDLCSDLFPEDPEAQVSWESSPFHSSIMH